MKNYICIDIGGTSIKYGLLSENEEFIERKTMPTEAHKGGPKILEKIINIVEHYSAKNEVSGICVSTAGMVDIEKGEIFYAAPLIPNYTGTKIKETLEKRFSLPCEVENDVNCAGLAEYESGAAKGAKTALILTIGTGIGGCFVLNGEVYRGASQSACEIGYMHMDESDFQTLGATSILTKKVAQKKQESEDKWSGYQVFEAAKQGDTICNQAIYEMCNVLGKGIANLCYMINPEVVVLGGGIMAQKDFLNKKIDEALSHYLLPSIKEHTKVEYAKHENNAGMLGAYYHFIKRH